MAQSNMRVVVFLQSMQKHAVSENLNNLPAVSVKCIFPVKRNAGEYLYVVMEYG